MFLADFMTWLIRKILDLRASVRLSGGDFGVSRVLRKKNVFFLKVVPNDL